MPGGVPLSPFSRASERSLGCLQSSRRPLRLQKPHLPERWYSGQCHGRMSWLYRNIARPFLFAQDSEAVHNRTLGLLAQASHLTGARKLAQALFETAPLPVQTMGLRFPNPVGLAAGMDKQAVAVPMWEAMGFGFSELGGVTAHAQPGNPLPRMFRYVPDEALVNRMGFNNGGAAALAECLAAWRTQGLWPSHPVGINLGKSKITPLDQAAAEYAHSFRTLWHLADFFVVNVSSPNTPGLRDLQEEVLLRRLVERLRRLTACPPLLVKIAPDLEDDAIDAIARMAYEEGLAGVIAVNTSINRFGLENRRLAQTGGTLAQEAGGLSGAPLRGRALEVLRRLRATAGPALPLIGVGGIDSPQSAWERITAGASLVQLYTGWIYQGPVLVPQILEGFSRQLDSHGLAHLGDAVGTGLPWRD